MKILHIAPFNIAGVPLTLVKAEQKTGVYSRLITLGREKQERENDVCVNLPFLYVNSIKKILYTANMLQNGKTRTYESIPPVWKPQGPVVENLIRFRDLIWEIKLKKFFSKFNLDSLTVQNKMNMWIVYNIVTWLATHRIKNLRREQVMFSKLKELY